jgi:hypothetical protein
MDYEGNAQYPRNKTSMCKPVTSGFKQVENVKKQAKYRFKHAKHLISHLKYRNLRKKIDDTQGLFYYQTLIMDLFFVSFLPKQ